MTKEAPAADIQAVLEILKDKIAQLTLENTILSVQLAQALTDTKE